MYFMINIFIDFVIYVYYWDVLFFKDIMFGKSNML